MWGTPKYLDLNLHGLVLTRETTVARWSQTILEQIEQFFFPHFDFRKKAGLEQAQRKLHIISPATNVL